MTDFLPKSPLRKWHPSQWNIVRVGSALGTTLALGACQDDTTSATDDGDVSDTLDNADYEDWADDYTDYSDYADWSDDYTDYSDYADYGDWADDDYTDWYYECYVDEDCGAGMQCNYGYCVPLEECSSSSDCAFDEFCDDNGACQAVDLPAQCLAPALTQIPLPEAAGGVVVALRFVDIDTDGAQELVLLRDDAVVVVDGDQSMTVPHTGFALDGLAATDVDDDDFVDLIATSSTKLNSRVFLADGMGGFFDGGVGPGMRLDQVHGIDWPTGGSGELVARTQGGEVAILSTLAQLTPDIEPVDPGPVEAVAVGDFNGNGREDVAMLRNCQPLVNVQVGTDMGLGAFGPPGPCSLSAGDFDGDIVTDLATLRSDDSFSVVSVQSSFDLAVVGLPSVYRAAQLSHLGGSPRSLLVLAATGELELLFGDDNLAWCRGQLDELPPVSKYASADFDGDGDEELAVIDVDGAVSLWSTD